jgi:hypothetical protein
MPGGRLTDQDRQRIAEGLAEGHTFADIARSLGRPKSTISREVARNGGTEHYEPGRAQQATRERARRRGPSPRPGAAYGCDDAAVEAFAEQLTELVVAAGTPRMAARVLSCLYTTDSGSITSAELVARLRVSPASISTAIAYLEAQDLVARERGERRRERYVINDGVWMRNLETSVRHNVMLAEAARQGAGILGRGTPAGARLDRLGLVLGHVAEDMDRSIKHWGRKFSRSTRDASGDYDV